MFNTPNTTNSELILHTTTYTTDTNTHNNYEHV